MMDCILNKDSEHAVATEKDVRYAKTFVNCPLYNGRQVCLWCCLHISDIASPLRRYDALELHPTYADIPDDVGRDWDEVWQVCSKCQKSG